MPMTRLRTRIAERLVQAQSTAAMLTTFNEVDLKAVNELRARYRDRFEKEHGARLGFMSFFVKACVEALKRYPVVNASVDGNDIVYHEYYDIGVAVSTDRGLLVPVLRDADALGFGEIEKAVVGFANRAREGSITLEELTGGTFTITNGGVFGSLLSTPILNMPQSAILGMHKIQERPVVGGRPDGRAPDDVPGALLRSPPDRRPRGRAVPGRDQGRAGGSRASAAAGLSRRTPCLTPTTSSSSAPVRPAIPARSARRRTGSRWPASTSGRTTTAATPSAAPA